MSNSVSQKNINAAGNVVAGDLIVHNHEPESLLRQIEDRLSGLAGEIERHEFHQLIEQFDYYYSYKPEGPIRSLEEKLGAAGRNSFLPNGRRQKELFVKMLEKHIFSETAQNVYALILGRVDTLFNAKIYPLLKSKEPDILIITSMYEEIVCDIMPQLKALCFVVNDTVIYGMIHFLTGKCLLEWE